MDAGLVAGMGAVATAQQARGGQGQAAFQPMQGFVRKGAARKAQVLVVRSSGNGESPVRYTANPDCGYKNPGAGKTTAQATGRRSR